MNLLKQNVQEDVGTHEYFLMRHISLFFFTCPAQTSYLQLTQIIVLIKMPKDS